MGKLRLFGLVLLFLVLAAPSRAAAGEEGEAAVWDEMVEWALNKIGKIGLNPVKDGPQTEPENDANKDQDKGPAIEVDGFSFDERSWSLVAHP